MNHWEPFQTIIVLEDYNRLVDLTIKQAVEIERLRGQVEFEKKCRNDAFNELKKQDAEIERLREDLIEAEKYNGYHQHACLEIERLRAEKERLGRQVNIAKYGEPDFAWSFHQAAMADLRNEIEQLREALKWIAGCEGGDIFDLWKEMRDTARSALQQNGSE